MTCLLYWHTGFRGEDFKTFFPIGSYIKTTVCPLKAAILDGGQVTGHNFENCPLKDHPCHGCFKLADWFQRRRFLNIFPIGSYFKTMSADGGHLGWRFGSLDIILNIDHLRTIHAMFAINWLTGFRGIFF
jgi:hypothetical protein